MLPVVGQLRLFAPDGKRLDTTYSAPCDSPPASLGRCGGGVLEDYTLLEESLLSRGTGLMSLALRDDGGIDVAYTGGATTIDRFGNPSSGPNVGRNLQAMRREFFVVLARLMPLEQPVAVASVIEALANAERSMAPILAEAPYRATLGIVGAQALARLGAGEQARAVLDRTVATAPYEGIGHVRAQLAALAGDLDAAVAILRPIVDAPATQRGRYDAPVLLMHLAIERRDRNEAGRCIAMLSAPTVRSTRGERVLADALWARAHLWWDEVGPVDCQADSSSLAPAGAALAVLARWRLGRTLPEDAGAMELLAEAQPDAAGEARLALAAARLAGGDVDAALAELTSLAQQLAVTSQAEFADRQLLDLTTAMLATAEASNGDCPDARGTAHGLLATATLDLLPAILATEALDRCPG